MSKQRSTETADPDETRKMLELKGGDNARF